MPRFSRLAAMLLAGLWAGAGWAEDFTSEDIVRGLTPPPLTREFRGIDVEGGAPPAAPPSVDLHVSFAYDSARLDTDARLILKQLGEALADPRLAPYSFVLGGHTDASGSDAYNMTLSQSRANAVRDYLVNTHGIARDRMMALGYGETRLADPANPEAAINRRVQVVNIGDGDG